MDFVSCRVSGRDSLGNEIEDSNVVVFVIIGKVVDGGEVEKFEVHYLWRRMGERRFFYESCLEKLALSLCQIVSGYNFAYWPPNSSIRLGIAYI